MVHYRQAPWERLVGGDLRAYSSGLNVWFPVGSRRSTYFRFPR
jgi:hypothetical protein